MYVVTAFVVLGLTSIASGYTDDRVESIVKDVTAAKYDSAIATTLELNSDDRLDLIREAIDGLINNRQRNLLDYSYRVKNEFYGGVLFKNAFPEEIQRILNKEEARLIDRMDVLPLKLGGSTDSDGDRTAYGDGTENLSNVIAWEFESLFKNNVLTFHIRNVKYKQYLKLGSTTDSSGDHTAYGGTSPSNKRFEWFLVPVKLFERILFYIVNSSYKQALKLGRSEDSDGDRVAYGHNGKYRGKPEEFGWYVNEFYEEP